MWPGGKYTRLLMYVDVSLRDTPPSESTSQTSLLRSHKTFPNKNVTRIYRDFHRRKQSYSCNQHLSIQVPLYILRRALGKKDVFRSSTGKSARSMKSCLFS